MARRQSHHLPTEHARNYAQIAFEFARSAVRDTGGKKHCKWVRLAAKRHLDDLKKSGKKRFGYYFSEYNANDVCDFAEKFPHVEGEWDTETIHLEPAQIFILCCVFGWRRMADDTRRFRFVYIEMARKGAKSTLTAIICHYCLTCEGALGPQVIIGASTGAQAEKVFGPAKQMASRTPDYMEEFGVKVYARSIYSELSGGFIQTINSKSSTQDGWNPHVGVLDELHAHKDRGLFDVIRSAFGARKNPLMWIITTAGYNLQGVCFEQRTLVTKVLESVIVADHYFGIIFTLDEADDPYDESKWVKANPLLGITPSLESMREMATEAKGAPGTAGEFKTKRLNIWTAAKGAWLNMEHWARNSSEPLDLDLLKKLVGFGAIDLASVSDLTVFMMAWLVDGRLKLRGRYYLPEETVRPRTERGNVAYQQWVDEGWLITTPGEVTDYDYIEQDVKRALGEYQIKEVGFDRWNSSQLVNNLLDSGAPLVEIAQGAKTFNPAMVEFERLLKLGAIDHGGDPVLKWAASNLVARRDINNNLAPDKLHSEEKIDPMVAALMALGRAMIHQQQAPQYRALFV